MHGITAFAMSYGERVISRFRVDATLSLTAFRSNSNHFFRKLISIVADGRVRAEQNSGARGDRPDYRMMSSHSTNDKR